MDSEILTRKRVLCVFCILCPMNICLENWKFPFARRSKHWMGNLLLMEDTVFSC